MKKTFWTNLGYMTASVLMLILLSLALVACNNSRGKGSSDTDFNNTDAEQSQSAEQTTDDVQGTGAEQTTTQGTEGTETESAHEHNWAEATCYDPKTCLDCGETEGEAADHTGGVAACMKKAVCDVCGKEYGKVGPHRYDAAIVDEKYLYSPATMTSAAKYCYSCSMCSARGYVTFESGETLMYQKSKEYKLMGTNGETVEKFMYFTDPHYVTAEKNGTFNASADKHFAIMKSYYDAFEPSFVACGGDWLNDTNTRENAIEMMTAIRNKMDELFGEAHLILGNHDYNYQTRETGSTTQSDQELTLQERIDVWFSKYGSTYYSFSGQNTKFYVFDSGKDWGHAAMTDYDVEQVNWFLGELEKCDDAHIALLPHQLYVSETTVHPATDKFAEIGNVYNNRGTFNFDGKTYDFSQKSGRVEFIMAGHSHRDEIGKLNGIPYILTCPAKSTTPDGTPSFDMVCVDYDNRVIKTVRIGTASDRLIYLDTCEIDHYEVTEEGHRFKETCELCYISQVEAEFTPHVVSDLAEKVEANDGIIYRFACSECGYELAKTSCISSSVNYFSSPGRVYNRWEGANPAELIFENGLAYARAYFTNHSGSFCVTNGDNLSTKAFNTAYDKVDGMGKYAVFKIRCHGLTSLKLGAQTDQTKTGQNGDKFIDNAFYVRSAQDISAGEWKVYVVDLSALESAYFDADNADITAAVFGFQALSDDADAGDMYVDVAYFAICDDWTEVASVVGDDWEL